MSDNQTKKELLSEEDLSFLKKETNDNEKSSSKNFLFFARLSNFFINKKQKLIKTKLQQDNINKSKKIKSELQYKIDELLKNDLEEVEQVLLAYLGSGYQLTKAQAEKVALKLEFYNTDDLIRFLNQTSVSQLKFDNFFVSKVFFQLLKANVISNINENISDFNRVIQQSLLDPQTNDLIYNSWINNLNELIKLSKLDNYQRSSHTNKRFNYLKTFKITYAMEYGYKHLFKSKDMNELFELARKINAHSETIDHRYSAEIIEDLNKISEHIMYYAQKACIEELEETKDKIKEVYSEENLDELIVKETNKELEHKKIKDLPIKGINIVNQIKEEYALINKNIKDLSEQDSFDVTNLLEKHVPKIINNYLKLDEDYRKSMIHINGKNSEELMIEGLSNILEKLQEIREVRNQEGLSDLSASTRYTNKI